MASKRSELTVGLGDFQTPRELASRVLGFVRSRGFCPSRILEPTCGRGAFVEASFAVWNGIRDCVGIERNPIFEPDLRDLVRRFPRFRYSYADALHLGASDIEWTSPGPLLICGNLPWVTTDALSRLSDTYQTKLRDNPKNLRGLDAVTGSGAFDISERLTLKLIQLARTADVAEIALLVKESVARRVLLFLKDSFASACIVHIDSRKWFDVGVQSCMLQIRFDKLANQRLAFVEYFEDFDAGCAQRWNVSRGVVRKYAVGLPPVKDVKSNLVWRHGIKHDAASVFEFEVPDAARVPFVTGPGGSLDLTSSYIFPLVTARDLHKANQLSIVHRYLFVPQRKLGDRSIESDEKADRERKYLLGVERRLRERRSSIYVGKPPYSIFGVGEYTFALFKVAVAGLYARPRFRFLGPIDQKPVVLGDTSYFIRCESAIDAAIITTLGNEPTVSHEVSTMVFAGKRPITKKVLDALDFKTAFQNADMETLVPSVTALLSSWRDGELEAPTRNMIVERASVLLGSSSQ